MPNLPTGPAMYPLMFPHNVYARCVESGEWVLHKASLVENNCDFDIHQWWGSMKEQLPTMYPYAIQTLCIPLVMLSIHFPCGRMCARSSNMVCNTGCTKRMSHLDSMVLWMPRENRITKGNGLCDVV